MPFVLGCFALIAPRGVIVLVWLFSDYLGRAYDSVSILWPILGFLFLPVTTLAYAWGMNHGPGGAIAGIEIVVLILAVLVDVGIIGGNARGKSGHIHHSR